MNECIWIACQLEVQWICMPMGLLISLIHVLFRTRVVLLQAVRCPLFPYAKQKLLFQGVAQGQNPRPSASTMYRSRLKCRTRCLLATLHALSKPTDDIPTYKFQSILRGPCIPAEEAKARIACFIRPTTV